MKKSILIITLTLVSMMFINCSGGNQTSQNDWDDGEVRDYNGEKVVVIKDDDGSDILMNYLLYQSLMNQGYNNRRIRDYHYDQYRSNPAYVNNYNVVKQRTVTVKPTVIEKIKTSNTSPSTTSKPITPVKSGSYTTVPSSKSSTRPSAPVSRPPTRSK